jgi:carbon storage regulator
MLVLTRRVDESIAIGDNIHITVLAVEGDRVKIGISAPREITILRQEVFEAIQAQNRLQEKLATTPEPNTFEQLRKLLAEDTPSPKDEEKKE